MKKKVLFLLPLFLGACSDSGESPVITIEKLYVKVDQGDGETIREDYANRMSEMPALKVGCVFDLGRQWSRTEIFPASEWGRDED